MPNFCEHCDHHFTNPTCPRCGRKPTRVVSDPAATVKTVTAAPDVDDEMVVAASRPSLATLVKRGLKAGYIHVAPEYTQGRRNN